MLLPRAVRTIRTDFAYFAFSFTLLQALLPRNAKVYIAGRSLKKAEEAMKDLRQQTGKDAHFIELDLASLASVRRAAKSFLQ